MIQDKTLLTLEYNKILEMLALECATKNGADFCVEIKPQQDVKQIEYMFSLLNELDIVMIEFMASPLKPFSDASECIKKAAIGSTLSIKELLAVASVLSSSRILKTTINGIASDKIENLKQLVFPVEFDKRLEDDITSAILSETELSDDASSGLKRIRRDIRKCNERIKEKLESYMRNAEMQKVLQDTIITMRGDRYVIPVKAESKNQVLGLVHDQSQSGATVFIEPMAVVELNNTLKSLTLDERLEIERILAEFTKRVGFISGQLDINIKILTEIDVLLAKSSLGYKWKAVTPSVNDKGIIQLVKARHPLLNVQKIVPISIKLGDGYDFITITGANTGGKTVTLKTVGLFCLLASSGMRIPCESGSRVSVFKKIFCDIGDEQSIENNLSTFSSHIANLKYITDNADNRTLVLLDEIGGGTDPDEGSALAIGMLEYLLKKGCKGILTTHYSQLKEYCLKRGSVLNASMEFDYKTLMPTYKLNLGLVGSSNALDIALRLGLSSQIIDIAKSNLTDEKKDFERVLRQAELLRKDAENEKSELEKIKIQQRIELEILTKKNRELDALKEKLNKDAKSEARRILQDAKSNAEELLLDIKKIINSNEVGYKDYIDASKLVTQFDDKIYIKEEDKTHIPSYNTKPINEVSKLEIGVKVFVKSLNNIAVISAIKKDMSEVTVNVGSLSTTVSPDNLMLIVESGENKNKKSVEINRNIIRENIATEINLLGQTVLEALQNLDDFIDRAVIAGLNEVRIVHGVGTGKLRQAVSDHLKKHKNILQYRFGKYGEGERGVTIATIK